MSPPQTDYSLCGVEAGDLWRSALPGPGPDVTR